MKKQLQDKLISKHSILFDSTIKIHTSDNSLEVATALLNQKDIVLPIQFGFECGDGWYILIDELMDSIKAYINSHNESQKYHPKNKIIGNVIKALRIKCKYKSFMYKTFDYIYDKLPKGREPMFFSIDQIKEKYGSLRFYYTGGDDTIFGMVWLAENLSYSICETCGTTKNVGHTTGWTYTTCKKCFDKNERANNIEWLKNK
jgi:hypothetical protein